MVGLTPRQIADELILVCDLWLDSDQLVRNEPELRRREATIVEELERAVRRKSFRDEIRSELCTILDRFIAAADDEAVVARVIVIRKALCEA